MDKDKFEHIQRCSRLRVTREDAAKIMRAGVIHCKWDMDGTLAVSLDNKESWRLVTRRAPPVHEQEAPREIVCARQERNGQTVLVRVHDIKEELCLVPAE